MYRTLRKRDATGALVLTERDKLWLRAIHRYRFITTDQAVSLATLEEGRANRTAINGRLAKLYDHGFLERPAVQVEQTYRKKRHTVHALGQAGAAWLTRNDGVQFPKGKGWKTASELKSFERMSHDIGMVDTVLHIANTVERHPDLAMIHQLELLASTSWPKGLKPYRLPTRVMSQGRLTDRGTDPDYTFALAKVVDGEERRALFFLEYDTGSEDHIKSDRLASSIGQKHECYNDAHERKLAKELYGINNFRVLFVIDGSADRVAKFRAVFQRKIGIESRAGVFLYTTVAELAKQGALDNIWIDGLGDKKKIA